MIRKNFYAPAALFLIAVLAAPARLMAELDFKAATEQIIIIQNYNGKFANDERFHRLISTLQENRQKTLQEVYELTGLYLPMDEFPAIVCVKFQDNKNNWQTAEANAENIIFFLPNIFRADIRRIFKHEMFHVMQYRLMPKENYAEIPKWIREGLAVFVSGEGPNVVKKEYKNLLFPKQFNNHRPHMAIVNNLFGERYPDNYAANYLVFQSISEKYGHDAMKQLITEITYEKKPYKQVLEKITGKNFKNFQKFIKEYAENYLSNLNKLGGDEK